MVFITVESYKNAGVNVIKDNKDYFWVKMKDIENGLGLKNVSSRLENTLKGVFESKNLTKEQKKKKKQYVKSKNEINKNLKDKKSKYCRHDIAERIIKNCRSIKGNNKLNKLTNINKEIKYLLCVIDLFSRYSWVVPLKNKILLKDLKVFLKIRIENLIKYG